MELRQLWSVLRRWWWLILLPPLVVAAYSLVRRPAPPPVEWAGSLRYTAGQPGGAAGADGYDPNYYRWLASEYIVTGLRDWVRTGDFARAVSAELAARGIEVAPGSLQSRLVAENSRSILVVYLTWPDRGQAVAIFEAVSAVLQNQNAAVFPQLGGQPAQVVALDRMQPENLAPTGQSLRSRLDLPLKLGLALALGLGLALAAHYLDPFVRERRELEAMGLPVIGELPRTGGKR